MSRAGTSLTVCLSIDKVGNGVESRSDGTVLKRYAPSEKLEIIEDDLAMKLYITGRGEKRSLYLLEN